MPTFFSRLVPGTSFAAVAEVEAGTRAVADNQSAFQINFVPGRNIRGNADALAALERAAAQWETHLFDPITVTIKTDFTAPNDRELPEGVLGAARPVQVEESYATVRPALAEDSLPEGDDSIVAHLPSAESLQVKLPPGYLFSGNLSVTKANLKAIGLHSDDIDMQLGVSDGDVLFSHATVFDFDNRDGVEQGAIDFETIAVHEIGHILGFVSAVDDVNAGPPGPILPSTLDLYRFQELEGPFNPLSPATFEQTRRELRPMTEAVVDFVLQDAWNTLDNEYPVEIGDGPFAGRQASHWLDDDLRGSTIGVMKPTFAQQQIVPLSNVDLRAFDLIGYDILPPESTNQPPVANNDTLTMTVGASLTFDVLDNDMDAENQLDPASLELVTTAASGSLSFEPGGGVFSYIPDDGFVGTDFFTYRVSDELGISSKTALVTIEVRVAGSIGNQPPDAQDDSAVTPLDTPITIPVLLNDLDADDPLLPASISIVARPANGQVSINESSGGVTYTPDMDFVGIDTFQYTINDGRSESVPATVTVAVGTNLPPAAAPEGEGDRRDTNRDGAIAPVDALLVINHLNAAASSQAAEPEGDAPDNHLDVNQDGGVTPIDVLLIVNFLNNAAESQEGEGKLFQPSLFAALQQMRRPLRTSQLVGTPLNDGSTPNSERAEKAAEAAHNVSASGYAAAKTWITFDLSGAPFPVPRSSRLSEPFDADDPAMKTDLVASGLRSVLPGGLDQVAE